MSDARAVSTISFIPSTTAWPGVPGLYPRSDCLLASPLVKSALDCIVFCPDNSCSATKYANLGDTVAIVPSLFV